jgi:outer membrane protein OmpA-like peptidoglycan-associated protein
MKTIEKNIFKAATFALFIILAGMTAMAQETTSIPEGQRQRVLGYINAREADSFTVQTVDKSKTYVVALTSDTSVKSNTKGIFRGGTRYESSYLLRGLRVEVEGRGNADGALVADSVRFNETDLRSAQALETRMEPVEQQVKSNSERIAATEENQKKLEGQLEETQAKADLAALEAARANNRINGLDDWDMVKTVTVPFATGSSTIGPKGKAIIEEAAKWVKTQDTKGWMVAIVGFADSTGKTAANKTLSERRANAVIGYLVTKYNLQLTRLVQPFGAGVEQPVATNATNEGRALNRRVEIRLLRNKGISEK